MPIPTKTIYLVGPSNSGKTWMRTVVFERRLPLDLVLERRETEVSITKVHSNNFLHLSIYDFPGDATSIEDWNKADAIVYVLDAQEDLRKGTIQDLKLTFEKAKSFNENIVLEIFVNKVDGDPFSSEELRVEVQQTFQKQISTELGKDEFSLQLTSVYNPSIFEAWSLVIQRLIPNQNVIVELLDVLVETCKMEKAFLFDAKTRVYIATDHNPVDHQTLTLCADSLDLVVGFENVYGTDNSFEKDCSTSVKVKLSNDMLLYAKQVDRWLALVCMSRKESWVDPYLIERNMTLFKNSLEEVRCEEE